MPFMMVRPLFFSDPSFSRDHSCIMSAHFWTFKTHQLCQHKNVDRFEAAYAFHDGTSSLFSDPSSSRDHSYNMLAHLWTYNTHTTPPRTPRMSRLKSQILKLTFLSTLLIFVGKL